MMKRLSYKQQLDHPNWQRKRLEVMARDNFSCLRCGNRENKLNVHHSYYDYRFMLWELPDHSLKTLCEACHLPAQDAQLAIYEAISRFSITKIMQLAAFLAFTDNSNDTVDFKVFHSRDPVFESKRQRVLDQLEALAHE